MLSPCSTILFVSVTPLGDLFHIKYISATASKRALALEFCLVLFLLFWFFFFFCNAGYQTWGPTHVRQMFCHQVTPPSIHPQLRVSEIWNLCQVYHLIQKGTWKFTCSFSAWSFIGTDGGDFFFSCLFWDSSEILHTNAPVFLLAVDPQVLLTWILLDIKENLPLCLQMDPHAALGGLCYIS